MTLVTCDVTLCQNAKIRQGDMTVVYDNNIADMSEFVLYHLCCEMGNFSIPHRLILSKVA